MNHTRNHYLIGAAAIVLAIGGGIYVNHRVDAIPHAEVSPFAWPGINAEQGAKLVFALHQIGKSDVTIWCATANCTNLAEDLQYLAYLADWDTHSDFPIMGAGDGIRVSPDDATGIALAAAIEGSTGLKVTTEPGPKVMGKPTQPAGSYNIILGARH